MTGIPEAQKKAWGRMVVLCQMDGGMVSKISQCQILIDIFTTGITCDYPVVSDLPKEYISILADARYLFLQLTNAMKAPERALYRESEATRICQLISELLLPKCILNSYVLIDDRSFTAPELHDSDGNKIVPYSMINKGDQ